LPLNLIIPQEIELKPRWCSSYPALSKK